jgi:hypothetical protein
MEMKPFELRVSFRSPMVYYDPPTLDGIAAYAFGREKMTGKANAVYPWANGRDVGSDLLFGRILLWDDIPLASQFLPDHEPVDFFDSWKCRFESKYHNMLEFGKAKRQIDTQSGFYRSYNMPLPAKAVRSGKWFFIGDGERLFDAVRNNMVAFGKKSAQGFGWIDTMSLSESDFLPLDVLKKRPIPAKIAAKLGISGARKYCTYKPPYWGKKDVAECVVPKGGDFNE